MCEIDSEHPLPVPRARRGHVHRTVACGLLVAAAVAGCSSSDGGTGDDGASGRKPPAVPAPARSPARTLATLRTAVAAHDCRTLTLLVHSAYGPRRRSLCDGLVKQLSTLTASDGVKRHGTAAVVGYTDRSGRPRALVLALDTNRRYRIVFTAAAAKHRRTDARAGQATAAATAGVRAIEAGDCPGFLRVADRRNGIGDAPAEEVCIALTNLSVVPYLQADPAGRPEPEGSDSSFAFYTLRLGRVSGPRGVFTVIMQRRSATGPWRFVTVVQS